MRTHFILTPTSKPECGRGRSLSTDPLRVDCGLCKQSLIFGRALFNAKVEKQKAFEAQEPRTFAEPWLEFGNQIECKCGSKLFRQADRTCYGHYDNYVCASCGETTSRLTETGMSF